MKANKIFPVVATLVLPALLFFSSVTRAQTDHDIDRLFDWAEATYPQLFGSHQTSQKAGIWRYRYFPEHNTHVGVNDKREVFIVGDAYEDMTYVGGFDALLKVAGLPSANFTVGGPGADYPTLGALFNAEDLEPGDVVEVRGGIVYEGGIVMPAADGGAPGNPVILRGVGETRPHLRGGANTIEFKLSNHVVMEHFEISGTVAPVNTFRCVFHHAHDITLRDVYIHDCPRHGVQGADQDSGSLTIEYSEIANAGSGGSRHAIYMATDEVKYPGSVFRLQYSYVHDSDFTDGTGTGGHLIKSRAERNEIYYNWLEGAYYHELELIGPDPNGARYGWRNDLAREDSDIVGNVIVHTSPAHGSILRFGGDGTGSSFGRYRFVNNTVLGIGTSAVPTVFRLFDGIESLDAHNNVFWRHGNTGVRVVREVEAVWTSGTSRINGSNNWIDSGSTYVPAGFANSRVGNEPGFSNAAALDFRPVLGSPLLGGANPSPVTPAGYEIAAPVSPPTRLMPRRIAVAPGTALSRILDTTLDIGAYELEDGG
jgi:hypothetical protein